MRDRIIIPNGIYGITGDNFSNGKSNYQCVIEMIEGGIKIIQYRDKIKSTQEKIREIKEIRELCREKNVIFIVNDYVDIALLVDADGVHIGQEDMSVEDVRKLIGNNKIIGLSTHNITQGISANSNFDIDYIGVGPIFPTTTKDREAIGLDYLKYACTNFSIPLVAIGGIKEKNIENVLKYNVNRVALVSEIVGANDIVKKIKALSSYFYLYKKS